MCKQVQEPSSVSEPAPGQCKEPRVSGGITPGGGEFILGSCEQEVPRGICRDSIRSICRNTSAALGTFQEWMFGQERATEVWIQSEACMQLSSTVLFSFVASFEVKAIEDWSLFCHLATATLAVIQAISGLGKWMIRCTWEEYQMKRT